MRRFAYRTPAVEARQSETKKCLDADVCNVYFADVGRRVAEEVCARRCEPIQPRPPVVCSSAFRVHAVTLPQLGSALRGMSSSRAAGSDGMTIELLRHCFEVVGPVILHIINKSLVTGIVPADWKHAIVVPLYKSGDETSPANYRPISVLNVLSKLAEKVVSQQLVEYLTRNYILSPTQFAYRPAHSTESALLDIVSHVSNNTDKGMVTS